MISIVLDWAYLFATTFSAGAVIAAFIERMLHYRIRHLDSIVLAGLAAATVYAQSFSLVHGVGAMANACLAAACAAAFLCQRRRIIKSLCTALKGASPLRLITMLALVLFWAYCTSRGHIHYDSDLYHAQSIRWIEEYGIVKGLGNIHVRFAYNSSFFALSALYSMKFLAGQSLHAVNGFIALVVSLEVLKLMDIPARRRILLSDFARIGAFFYLTRIYDEVISPASDHAIMCVVFLIVIRWLVELEEGQTDPVPFALLCVAGVYAITLKLTAGLILLLALKPAHQLIKERRWKAAVCSLAMGLIVLAPWIARTAVLSGYLLYPFPQLDILDVDWKIHPEMAAVDAAEIRAWGRGLKDAALVDFPISGWFPGWFRSKLPMAARPVVAADIACAILFVVSLAYMLVARPRGDRQLPDRLLVLGTVIASYVFWQLSAPLLRYGYAYVLLTALLAVGVLKDLAAGSAPARSPVGRRICSCAYRVFLAALCAAAAGLLILAVRYMYALKAAPYYVRQEEYGTYELCSYEVEGVAFYHPVSGDRVGYSAFPAIPKRLEVSFRGEGIEDGFRWNGW